MKLLVMGSCRVTRPLESVSTLCPLGNIHSTSEMVQACEVMSGKRSIPENLKPYFYGVGKRENVLVDLSSIDQVVIEISSLKNHVVNGEIIINIGYEEKLQWPRLDNVRVQIETASEMVKNLKSLESYFSNSQKVLYVCHNTLVAVASRYMIAEVLSQWCKEKPHEFCDPTVFDSKYGSKEVHLLKESGEIDYNHYREDKYSEIAKEYLLRLR